MPNKALQFPPAPANAQRWARPKQVSAMYGFSNTHLYRLLAIGAFRSALFRSNPESKSRKGTRLIDLHSVEDYLRRHSVEPRQ